MMKFKLKHLAGSLRQLLQVSLFAFGKILDFVNTKYDQTASKMTIVNTYS